MTTDTTSSLDVNTSHQNYPLALLAGLVGALIGTIPFVLVAVLTKYAIGWLAVLIPVGAVTLFNKCYKSADKKLLSIIVLNIISIIIILGSCFMLEVLIAAMDPEIVAIAEQFGKNTFNFVLEILLAEDFIVLMRDIFVPLALPVGFSVIYGGFIMIPQAIKKNVNNHMSA